MKTLKIICIISFLLIEGMQQHASINFGMVTLYLYQFFHDIINFHNVQNIFWSGGLISILVIITLITLYTTKNYSDRFIVIVCIIFLFFCIMYIDGIHSLQNLKIGFIFPLVIFIISSFLLIILNFKKRE